MMNRPNILRWLKTTDEQALATLFEQADRTRQEHVGDAVHLRGLIEFGNFCQRHCLYCGLRKPNQAITRYRLCEAEIIECARLAEVFGYGTVVMQSGEDPQLDIDWLCGIVRRIKQQSELAITLSVGERSEAELAALREAGADRYLLRFESSNMQLLRRVHPPLPGGRPEDRLEVLRLLRRLGYEVGSGFMVGLPGQTYDDLVNDIELCRELDLDMIGLGPYLPHEQTPLGQTGPQALTPGSEQVPNTEAMTYTVVALVRIVCPDTNIPATTALATLNTEQGRELALQRGANVIMPNITPTKYRASYEIYPDKACITDSAGQCQLCIQGRVAMVGRTIGRGPGDSPNVLRRRAATASSV